MEIQVQKHNKAILLAESDYLFVMDYVGVGRTLSHNHIPIFQCDAVPEGELWAINTDKIDLELAMLLIASNTKAKQIHPDNVEQSSLGFYPGSYNRRTK